jgi:hypothetical protein
MEGNVGLGMFVGGAHDCADAAPHVLLSAVK